MSQADIQLGTIETRIPARMDRLPWSGFHWRIIIGLGTVWILDGLEVTMVGNVAARLTENDSGIDMTSGDIGLAGAIYIIGACVGALVFGHITDRAGRKKLFMITLAVYIAATFATAFAWAPWFFFLMRFFTGSGIGGEYAAINSAIDELIPSRVRGRVDLVINGTYWAGAAGGAALALVLLNKAWIPADLGWRFAFGVGVILGLLILLVRRHVPESPRWMFIHGYDEEAERLVDQIEDDVIAETGQELAEPGESLTVRQRRTIPFRTIAHTAFKLYPKRAILGIALFVGQAFIYNGITFDLGTLFHGFYDVASSAVPVFFIIFAVGNFLGPVLLGKLFDTVGRKPMISGMYIGSAIVSVPLAWVFWQDVGNEWLVLAFIVVTFFLASAGASAAYLTVSEIFPMETRALAIAFFYAVGTGLGGIIGPLLFGKMIDSDVRGLVAIAFLIGAAVMAIGGIFELLFGVKAERASLESIAIPLTASEGDQPGAESGRASSTPAHADGGRSQSSSGPDHSDQLRVHAEQAREDAERARAKAADHRAEQLALSGGGGTGGASGKASTGSTAQRDSRAQRDNDEQRDRAGALADIEELRAEQLEQQALALDERAAARRPGSDERAQAADQRAFALSERADAVSAADESEAQHHLAKADAAEERARSHEQLAMAAEADASAGRSGDTDAAGAGAVPQPVAAARAELHRAWSRHHEERSAMFEARADGRAEDAASHEAHAADLEQQALAAEQRVEAAGHRVDADQHHAEIEHERNAQQERAANAEQARERERREAERDQRIQQRLDRRAARGLARFRPGPSRTIGTMWGGPAPAARAGAEAQDREIEMIVAALDANGPMDRQELAQTLAARYWGPGRFGPALDTAVGEGRITRLSRRVYGPVDRQDTSRHGPGEHSEKYR